MHKGANPSEDLPLGSAPWERRAATPCWHKGVSGEWCHKWFRQHHMICGTDVHILPSPIANAMYRAMKAWYTCVTTNVRMYVACYYICTCIHSSPWHSRDGLHPALKKSGIDMCMKPSECGEDSVVTTTENGQGGSQQLWGKYIAYTSSENAGHYQHFL